MVPRREPLKTKDGRNYTLWADINDAMSAIIPAYWTDDRNLRREHGWIFRGQINSEWDLIPSLYRPPIDATILKMRQEYTDTFIGSLKKESQQFGLKHLSDLEYLAIAQHYGFYTSLLDFTWNAEVAAYFATDGDQPSKVGVIWAFNYKEYHEMRNPFAALGLSLEESDAALKNGGMEPLPDLKIVELYNIPRIYEQEGLFVYVTPEKIETLMHECIDRFYFRQRPGVVYTGNFAHKAHTLPNRNYFDCDASYEAFLDLIRKEKPDLFDRTSSFGSTKLFPPSDPLSKFAIAWKREHPAPISSTHRLSIKSEIKTSQLEDTTMNFSNKMEEYYYGEFSRSPYQSQYLAKGRELVESLCEYPELNNPKTQCWLLWELLKRNLPHGLKCTLKLGNAKSWSPDKEGFRFVFVDRWLLDSYQYSLPWEQIENSFCRIFFCSLSKRGRPEVSIQQVDPFSPPMTTQKKSPINPHESARSPSILDAIESRLAKLEEGVVGSFLYDFHHIVMLSMGRNLELTASVVKSAPCLQRSPLVRFDHVNGPAMLVRVIDHFTGGITHTAYSIMNPLF